MKERHRAQGAGRRERLKTKDKKGAGHRAQGAGHRERLKTEDKKGARHSPSTLLRVVSLSNEAQGAGKD